MTKAELQRRVEQLETALREAWLVLHVNHHRPGRYDALHDGRSTAVWSDLGTLESIISRGLVSDSGLTPQPPSQDKLRAKEAEIDRPYEPSPWQKQRQEQQQELEAGWNDILEEEERMQQPRDEADADERQLND